MFEGLKKSEIKKAEAAANKYCGRKDCKVTAWSAKRSEVESFYNVTCEICFNYEKRANFDVVVSACMWDRRKSWALVKTW